MRQLRIRCAQCDEFIQVEVGRPLELCLDKEGCICLGCFGSMLRDAFAAQWDRWRRREGE